MGSDHQSNGSKARDYLKMDATRTPPALTDNPEGYNRWAMLRVAKAIAWGILGIEYKLQKIGMIQEERLNLECQLENVDRADLKPERRHVEDEAAA